MKKTKAVAAIMLMIAVFFAFGCEKDINDYKITVNTFIPRDITATTALCGADVTVSNDPVLDRLGVCWGMDSNPTIDGNCLSTTKWNEPYSCTLTGLTPETNYHVRAFVQLGSKCLYGSDISFTTESEVAPEPHDYVDLGLPSGTLWATCNIGATAAEDYGDYFAWAEVQPVLVYNWSYYKYCNGDYNQLTRYCTQAIFGYNGFVDNNISLVHSDDAATVNWGDSWSIPTDSQWEELYQETTNFWTTQNGVNGRLFTASNGNSLFLPAGGAHTNAFNNIGEKGYYWSKKLSKLFPFKAICFTFKSDEYELSSDFRFYNFSVRPVTKY